MELNKYFDHTILKPEATEEDVKRICAEARKYDFASVCINPCYVPLAAKELKGTDVKVCTVIGFPLGANSTKIKAEEARDVVANGAQEVDMVLNVGKVKEGNYEYIAEEVAAVKEACDGRLLKVILETLTICFGVFIAYMLFGRWYTW